MEEDLPLEKTCNLAVGDGRTLSSTTRAAYTRALCVLYASSRIAAVRAGRVHRKAAARPRCAS